MKLTKQQQVLGGVMFLGLIAVGVDRFMPKAGAATEADSADLLVEHHSPVAPATATNLSRTHLFNQRLASNVTNIKPHRGAFELATVWQSAAKPTAAAAAENTATDEFANNHRLSNTMARGEHSGAVIDGKLIVVGQTIDGFKLLSVTGRTATLSNGHAHVTLNQIAR